MSNNAEVKVIATIWKMGAESLNPEEYADLERVLSTICERRKTSRFLLGIKHAVLSGKAEHHIDCSVNNAPSMLPTPCDCDAK